MAFKKTQLIDLYLKKIKNNAKYYYFRLQIKFIMFKSLLVVLSILCIFNYGKSQIVNSNAFLQGKYVEVGVSQCGSFGSSVCAPGTYHARGTGNSSATCQLGFIANPAKDNWANYVGDYFLPGTPEEGWGLILNGTN